ncbi:MFS transporter [Bacteriovorax sp. PP10]|uniref:MFS transporter n=1 Tax=Bacteriovorax antarcticus TaxID=3088717 RepID=A0ABU5VSQ3_9BACT|nr:MFS transporter [Bacteriovorax sp. PP10]MEA9356083.1 MFS transporter [Bacteriovorax sp. PP10]
MKRTSPMIPIFLIVLVDVLGMTIILPLLPFYSESLGATPFTVGMIVAVYGLCQFIAGPILGQASDKVGRKKILVISQIGTCLGFIMLALSHSLVLIFLARIIDGLTAGNISVAQAYVADVTEPKDRTKAFGMLGAAFSLGFIIGPALSGFLAKYGAHYPIFLAACLSAVSIIATITILPNTEIHKSSEPRNKFAAKNIHKYFRVKEVAPLLLQFFAFAFAFSFFMSGFAMFLGEKFFFEGKHFGPQQVGWIFTFIGCMSLIVQVGVLRRLSDFMGEKKIVFIGFVAMSLGYFFIGETATIPFLLLALILNTFGSSVLRPSITSQITKIVPKDQQGTILGVTQSLQSVAQIVAPLIGGYLIGTGNLTGWAWSCSFIAFCGILLLFYQEQVAKRVVIAA